LGEEAIHRTSRLPVSAVLIVKNEEQNLPRCLGSLKAFDEVVVVDEYSADRTQEIAISLGARVLERKLTTFAELQNWALDEAGLRNDWVIFVYADEEFLPTVDRAIAESLEKSDGMAGYLMCGKIIFEGRWIKHSSSYPAWEPKLIHRKRCRFVRSGHTFKFQPIEGEIGKITESYLHHNFSKGYVSWWERHNRYSTDEALVTLEELQHSQVDLSGLWSRDDYRRRQAWRGLAHRIPLSLRPMLRFSYLYFAKLGFLDGRPGFTFAMLQGIFEYMCILKVRELKLREKGQTL